MAVISKRFPFLAFVVLISAALLILLNSFGIRKNADNLFLFIRSNFFTTPSSSEVVAKCVIDLKELQTLQRENAELRTHLDFSKKTSYTMVLANILARDPLNKNVITLDTGLNQGVRPGQAIIVDEGIIVGKIIAVSSENSIAETLLSPGMRLSVTSSSDVSIRGLVRGVLGTGLQAEYLPSVGEPAPGDIVVTSGDEPSIPAGLLVGSVSKVTSDTNELFATVDITPAIDLRSPRIVSIIIGI